MNEYAKAQHDLRYAMVNDLYPGLITAHLVDAPLRQRFDITAYLQLDDEIMRMDAGIDYDELHKIDDLLGFIINLVDLNVQKFKEKNT